MQYLWHHHRNNAAIIDRMAVVQKYKPTGKTFKQMASEMLELILSTTKQAERISIVLMFTGNHLLKMHKDCVDRQLNSVLVKSYPAR